MCQSGECCSQLLRLQIDPEYQGTRCVPILQVGFVVGIANLSPLLHGAMRQPLFPVASCVTVFSAVQLMLHQRQHERRAVNHQKGSCTGLLAG